MREKNQITLKTLKAGRILSFVMIVKNLVELGLVLAKTKGIYTEVATIEIGFIFAFAWISYLTSNLIKELEEEIDKR